MSSSKIFKRDQHFTPTPLVQQTLATPAGTPPPPAPGGRGPTPPPKSAATDQPRNTPPPAAPEPPKVDLQAIKNEAYERGKADTTAQFQFEVQQTVKALAQACQEIDGQRRKLLARNRGDIVNLIITLSTKVLGQELATPRNIIATTLQNALEQAIDSEEYYVTLNPEDLAFAEAQAPELIAAIRGMERMIFKTDPGITRGGCLLESLTCSVDATIETQMEGLKELLQEQPDLLPIDPEE